MLAIGVFLGLALGLLSGGNILNLSSIRLRWIGVLFIAAIIRFGTEYALNADVAIVEILRLPLLATGFGLLLATLYINRGYPGLSLAFIGILLNTAVIVVNGGYMPIWSTALSVSGAAVPDSSAFYIVLPGSATDFLLHLLIIGDIIPIPIPFAPNVASLGDVFISLGLAFFLFAGVVRVPTELEEREEAAIRERLAGLAGTARLEREPGATTVAPGTGLAPALTEAVALERPLVMGTQNAGLAAPALAPLPPPLPAEEAAHAEAAALAGAAALAEAGHAEAAPSTGIARPSPETLARVRQHPYVRLALNGSFSALWAGQLISLFGDRIHLIALTAVVFLTTDSVFASALVFVAATLPNLVLSPIAGTLVDRWDHKEVLVVSDLLRAATVLLIPIAAVVNVAIIYPLVFLITTISIFFRPARVAILPRIVREDELLSANSALWVGETLADIVGWPLAGLFVASLGNAIPVAFWLDAATYIASAVLLSTIVVRPAGADAPADDTASDDERDAREGIDAMATAPATGDASADPVADPPDAPGVIGREARPSFTAELKAGWHFLRGEPSLLANTIQAAVAQLTVGVLIALTPAFALTVFGNDPLGWKAVYSFVEMSQGIGSLIGGFVVGLIGTRFAKGRMIIGGYAFFGFFLFLLSLTGNLGLVLGFAFGTGIANMVFLIPSQTLFQERTPADLMGRVVSFRFALVFGSMTLAMAVGGLFAEVIGVTTVIAISGLVTMTAGLAGLLVPAVRDI